MKKTTKPTKQKYDILLGFPLFTFCREERRFQNVSDSVLAFQDGAQILWQGWG